MTEDILRSVRMKINNFCVDNSQTSKHNSQTSFNGLWASYGSLNNKFNYYYPFADESADKIKEALKSRTYETYVPASVDMEPEYIISEAKEAKKLNFTEAEYFEYKNFYGKTMPDKIKKVEEELNSIGLKRYLNKGIFYSSKKFLHNLKQSIIRAVRVGIVLAKKR